MHHALLAIVCVLALAGAGCASPPPPEAPGQLQLKAVDIVGEGTGSISGVVVDEGIRPVPGANITGTGFTARTDASGLFTAVGLQPGLYTIRVNATGFLPVQSTAEVVPGEVAKMRIILPADLTPKPYHTTLKFKAYDAVGQGLADFAIDLVVRDFANGTLPPQCDQCYFYFRADSKPDTTLIEAAWEDSIQDYPEGQTEYYWVLDGLDSGDYLDDYCTSPCNVTIQGDQLAKDLSFGLGMSPDEDWVTYQQEWSIFVTLWYGEPPPAGWSFLKGDT